MRSLSISLAILLVGTSFLLSIGASQTGVTAIPGSSCTASTTVCTFTCHAGAYVRVHASAPANWSIGTSIPCGDVYASCSGIGGCDGRSATPVTADGTGVCGYTGSSSFVETCSSDDLEAISVDAVATPAVGGGPVGTPGLAEVCAPAGLVCVGPVAPIHLADLPPVADEQVTPPVLVAIDHSGAASAPQAGTTTVGPIALLGPPVPVTACADTCTIPWVYPGAMPSLIVVVEAGSFVQGFPILP